MCFLCKSRAQGAQSLSCPLSVQISKTVSKQTPINTESADKTESIDNTESADKTESINKTESEDKTALAKLSEAQSSADSPPLWFEEVTVDAGLNFVSQTWGASWGDFNGDGYADLWLNNHLEPSTLWLNEGDGTFRDATEEAVPSGQLGGDTHGAMWIDTDNDGDQDLFQLVGARGGDEDDPNLLYINENGILTDAAVALGVDYPPGRGRTPLALDYNNDGLLDLVFVGPKRPDGQGVPTIFKQTENGFEDVGEELGFTPTSVQKIPLALLSDLNSDGKAELIYRGGGSTKFGIYETDSDTFTDISRTLFPNFPSYPAFVEDDIAIADFNNDLLPDIYLTRNGVASDVAIVEGETIKARIESKDDVQGFKFKAQGSLQFDLSTPGALSIKNDIFVGSGGNQQTKRSFSLSSSDPSVQGFAHPIGGEDKGIYIGYDASTEYWQILVSSPEKKGVLSLLMTADDEISDLTSLGFDQNAVPYDDKLFINTGDGFVDRTNASGLDDIPLAGNNVATGDFDNDGDQDIYVVSTGSAANRPNVLYENLGDATFKAVELGGGAAGTALGRGDSVAVADYDLDGFLDLFVANGKWAPAGGEDKDDASYQLFNNVGNDNRWIQLKLEGVESNRDGIGSKVYVTASKKTQLREQNGGIHSRAQNFQNIHFGLGKSKIISLLEVQWASGIVDKHQRVSVDQVLTLKEGYGLDGGDILTGTARDNELHGLSGNDLLKGKGGKDKLYGGDGRDVLDGGSGADILDGGEGYDTVTYIESKAGVNVRLSSGIGVGGDANGDQLINIEQIVGSRFDDQLRGDKFSNSLKGGDGSDFLAGNGGSDTLIGGNLDDVLIGGLGADILNGGSGIDVAMYNRSKSRVLINLSQGKGFGGEAEGDQLIAIESVIGSDFNDQLRGNSRDNLLEGGDGADFLLGSGGKDTLIGGNGKDILIGGRGDDLLSGGLGADQFRFSSIQDGVDTIADFETGVDIIRLKGSKFGGSLVKGLLSSEQFTLGTGATDNLHRFVYNPLNGHLSFDLDGVGGTSQRLFAILSDTAALADSDIQIV